jgi:hypothetical protein
MKRNIKKQHEILKHKIPNESQKLHLKTIEKPLFYWVIKKRASPLFDSLERIYLFNGFK